MRSAPFLKQCFVTAAVCFNIVGHGCTLGFPAILLPQLKTPDSLIYLDTSKSSWIASAMAIPMLFGNFLSPPIMDRMGRKMAHYAVAIPVILGWFSIILAKSFECFVTAAVCSNIVSSGCILGYPAILLPQLRNAESPMTLTDEQDSWIASVISITMIIGNFISSSIMFKFGRRAAHYTAAVPAVVGWLLIAQAESFNTLIIARTFQGLSFGLLLPLRSVLIGEYTSPKNRGAFLTTISFSLAAGVFFVHLIGTYISWQRTALVCVSFSFASFVMTMFCPESPSFLASKGKYDSCRKAFRWLRGDEEEDELEELIKGRMYYNKNEKSKDTQDILATIQKKEFYKPIILMVHAHAMMQLSGNNIMASYSTVIITLIAGPISNASFWMIFLDAQRLISNFAAVFVINKCRRRTVLFSIGTLSVLTHIAISVYTYARQNGIISYDAIWLPILLINIHLFTVATGMMPMPHVLTGEVFPLQYRSIGSSISVVSGAIFTFIVLKTFPGLIDSVGIQGTYLVYAGSILYFLVVMFILLPETKGKTLQQIEDEFRGKALLPEENKPSIK